MQIELLKTADGSHTVLNKELNVTYHSTHGAVQESMHVYIEAGFKYAINKFSSLNILEVGFGTGLNALLTYNENAKSKASVNYETIEKFPLDEEIIKSLNYSEEDQHRVFAKLHALEWHTLHNISPDFSFKKNILDVNEYELNQEVHLVYYDAFAPNSAWEMWNKKIFVRIYGAMVPGACLVTFCAKGDIKRMLKTCGFKVEALAGSQGKREMTRAIKM